MPEPILHTSTVRAADSTPSEAVLFLHGILGTGGNLRGVAQAFVQAHPYYMAVLVDLRLHGRSQGFASPHDVRVCADDLVRLEPSLPLPVTGVIGHSFGGKVSLAYHEARPQLARVALLDSAPGPSPERIGSEQTLAVIDMLARAPRHYAGREDFIAYVHAEGHGRTIADWLAMNLERQPEGFRLRLDVEAVRSLLDSYFSLDLWPVLEGSRARTDVIIGGRSQVWSAASRTRLEALAAQKPAGTLRVHVLPEAGHWLHVDDPQGVRRALIAD